MFFPASTVFLFGFPFCVAFLAIFAKTMQLPRNFLKNQPNMLEQK